MGLSLSRRRKLPRTARRVKSRPSLPGGMTTAGFCIPPTRFEVPDYLAREVVGHLGRAHVTVAVGMGLALFRIVLFMTWARRERLAALLLVQTS
jgi:hypothetical protein